MDVRLLRRSQLATSRRDRRMFRGPSAAAARRGDHRKLEPDLLTMDTTRTDTTCSDSGYRAPLTLGIQWVYPRHRFSPALPGASLIGRDGSARVRLDDPLVSRRHATLERVGDQLLLRDEGSRNATRHNGHPINSCALSDNDVVRIGPWVGVVVLAPSEQFEPDGFGQPVPGVLVGPRTAWLWRRLQVVAKDSLPVVVEGESGTGKEVVAEGLHRLSARTGPWLAVNCSALPQALAEAQLFGHVRGAFTGAAGSATGHFVAADGGTLFLDEIADLALAQQPKLLRVIEDSSVTPLGSSIPRRVDVRLVCATQRPLWELVEEGRFRADLMARVGGLTMTLPPLRRRREEIPMLFRHFAGGAFELEQLKPSLVEALCVHSWPLNVRELALVAKRGRILSDGVEQLNGAQLCELLDQRVTSPPTAEPAPPSAARRSEPAPPSPGLGVDVERVLGARTAAWFRRHQDDFGRLQEAMLRSNKNISRAAAAIGISRQCAQRLLDAGARLEQAQTNPAPSVGGE